MNSRCLAWAVLLALAGGSGAAASTNWTLLGWNNLGMHCMDSDYSVFSILPPYNTFHAQLVDRAEGGLVTNPAGYGITYRAVADPDGSINRTSKGKTEFWQYSVPLFVAHLPEDVGLPVPGPETFAMPGAANLPQAMKFEGGGFNWFAAYGVPIVPYDDAGRPNQYPLLRLVATNDLGQDLAMLDIVVPVSDEMDCKLCHASGAGPAALPTGGWVNVRSPGRDYRLNILRLHDELNMANPAYRAALATAGHDTNGLYATVTRSGRPVLCASCHLSEALPGSGITNIPPLTEAMHGLHAHVVDPRNGLSLDDEGNRVGCYSCHPGSVTRCLRGAMGRAVAPDGTMAMQCQSCHGIMSEVGSAQRTGWLEEPNCQACHVGGANNSYGVIRFLHALTGGVLRTTTDSRFATNPDTPLPGISLYRFSKGHGGLQCSACHGSTHAEYPTSFRNDNIASEQIQGHAGVLGECRICHAAVPASTAGGPHGMHPVGQDWLLAHKSPGENEAPCASCHGLDFRGTVLSRSFSDQVLDTEDWGQKVFWRGCEIGCYTCHDGPNTSSPTTKGFPLVTDRIGHATSGVPAQIDLGTAHGRIVSMPAHGIAVLSNQFAVYLPDTAFDGVDTFTFCATNDYNDSNLGTVTVVVAPPPFQPVEGGTTFVFAVEAGPTGVALQVATRLASGYQMQVTTNLFAGPWLPAGDPVWGHTDSIEVIDPTSSLVRFYRPALLPAPPAPDALSTDSATNAPYELSWDDGSAGGLGWGSGWTLSAFGGGASFFFVSTTSQPAMSLPPKAWGLRGSGGGTAEAVRPFAEPMQSGDVLTLRFDNNWISAGGSVGVGLQNAAGQNLFEFLFIGGDAVYLINDKTLGRRTMIPWSDRGWNLSFRLGDDGMYAFGCGAREVAGALADVPDRAPARIKVWSYNAGDALEYDCFFTDVSLARP